MLLFPNAKINIGLDVLRRREDGFHDIRTLMVPVEGLCDVLEISRVGNDFVFVQTGAPVDCAPEDNLCMRACRLMQREYGIGGAKIHLHKIIPSGAGLGGGSADAALVIKGLNTLFGLRLDDEVLEKLAATLGSDTPFFIRNRPAVATGRGEILTPAENPFAGKHIIIVKPDIHISTREAYSGVVPREPEVPLRENAFEAHLFAAHPLLARIKQALVDHGAIYASMSGSGSAIYGVFDAPPPSFCFSEKNCTTLQFVLT
jgi:4-diphosphocytidyl-2-C-methyl-D-erythritol kinase